MDDAANERLCFCGIGELTGLMFMMVLVRVLYHTAVLEPDLPNRQVLVHARYC